MSFAVSSIAMMGMGAVTSTIGAYNSASMQKDSLGFSAAISDLNARMSEQTAQVELQRGEREQQGSRLRTAQLKGRQRASMAANGIDLGVGSAVDVLTSTDVMGEIDTNTIQANAVRQAWGYRTQATSYQNDALLKRASADSISPGMATFSTLLTEGSKVGAAYMGMSKAGAFGSSAGAPGMGGNAGQGLQPGGGLGLKPTGYWKF